MSESLLKQGLKLHFFCGAAKDIIPSLIKESGATAISWNKLYEPDEVALDNALLSSLANIEIQRFDSNMLFTPGTLLNKQAQPYRVFTPFWKTARQQLEISGVGLTKTKKYKTDKVERKRFKRECTLDELGLLTAHPWYEKLHQHWIPGEATAQKRLQRFIRDAIGEYDVNRDIPEVDGTSKMSAHLHFGEITPAQIYYQLQQYAFNQVASKSVERFITELGWREFAHHVLWHFPHTTNQAMNDKFAKFWPKRANQKLLQAWQQGQTGFPIVDAGMRQLWQTGWMHNRVRMIVGSFLTKNLGIHWLHGTKWFLDTLVDADIASNTLGWQWVAGCGVDAAPYYRIFNPETQAKRFDPNATYIRHWVPEIDELSFQTPLIDLAQSREDALSRYKNIS